MRIAIIIGVTVTIVCAIVRIIGTIVTVDTVIVMITGVTDTPAPVSATASEMTTPGRIN
jgi:hypothetical protein